MTYRITRRGVNAGIGAALISPALARHAARFCARRRADQDRLRHGADRPACAQRPTGAARLPDLGGGSQCQGRPARPSGPTCPLRRPVQSLDHPRHLHETARRRQSRPRPERLRDQHGGARHSHRHAKGQALHRPVRARRERRVSLPEILLVHTDQRADAETSVDRRLLPGRGGAESEAQDRRDRGRGRRVRAQRRGRRPRQRQTIRLQDRLRQNLPAEHDRLFADHPRHPGRQCGSRRGRAPIR